MQVSGQFSLQIIKEDGSLRSTVNQENLVLNGLWNFINEQYFPEKFNIQLGTGDSEPNITDVTLNELLYERTKIAYQKISGVDDGNTICLRCSTEIPAGKISDDDVILREIGLFGENFKYGMWGAIDRWSAGDALITRSLIDNENDGQLVTPTDMIKITYDLRFTAPGGLMPQTSSLTIKGVEHQVSYEVAKLGEINIPPKHLLGSHRIVPGTHSSNEHTAGGWKPSFVKEVIVDREACEIQVIWERVFNEFSDATIEQFTLQKSRPHYVNANLGYATSGEDYVTIRFDPPIVKREGERLTLNGVFKTTINI